MNKVFSRWWSKPDWEVGITEGVLKFWIASVLGLGFLLILCIPPIAILAAALWLIWR